MIQVDGLSDAQQSTLNDLYQVWVQKLTRNRLRTLYYEQKNQLKDLGISIPPELIHLDLVMGWPTKAVDGLAAKCRPDTFVIAGGTADDAMAIWRDNDLDVEFPQTIKSALMHSCAFVGVSNGDTAAGEPKVLVSTTSAMFGAAIWSRTRRAISAALSITDTDDAGHPTALTLWLPEANLICTKDDRGQWAADSRPHSLGRVPVFPMAFSPDPIRPFGRSRISRAVMGIADSALRTAARTEVSAEFFSAPQRWMMGADESMFVDETGKPRGAWAALLGRIWAAGPILDDRGDVTDKLPQVGEFRASPQTPNVEHMRSLAMQFCGETSLTPESLGIVQDNPTSAESILYRQGELISLARTGVHDPMGSQITRAMLTAIQIRDNLDEIPESLKGLRFKWKNPETLSESAAADAVTKLVAAFPWMSESKVSLERLGWDAETIERAWADKERAEARQTARAVMQSIAAPQQTVEESPDESEVSGS